MKYVGIIRSGSNEATQIPVGTAGVERILPSASGDIYLTGEIWNRGQNDMLVYFYRTNRENQGITIHPGEILYVRHIPASRLVLEGLIGITTCEYELVQLDTESDEEDVMLLQYITLQKVYKFDFYNSTINTKRVK